MVIEGVVLVSVVPAIFNTRNKGTLNQVLFDLTCVRVLRYRYNIRGSLKKITYVFQLPFENLDV